MDKDKKAFEKLWKVKVLEEIMKLDDQIGGGTIKRSCNSDNQRALKFIAYGFKEGIKFAKKNNGK